MDSSGEVRADEGDDSLRGVPLPESHSSIMIVPTTTTTATIENPNLPLESTNNIHSSTRLPLNVLDVGNNVAKHILEKVLKDCTGLFLEEATNSLDVAFASQTENPEFRDVLHVVA